MLQACGTRRECCRHVVLGENAAGMWYLERMLQACGTWRECCRHVVLRENAVFTQCIPVPIPWMCCCFIQQMDDRVTPGTL